MAGGIRRGGKRSRAVVEALGARLLLKSIYVDADGPAGSGLSWASPTPSLQMALGMAAPGDTVHVAGGVYKPTDTADRTISFALKQGVQVLGGYAGHGAPVPSARDIAAYETILSGDIGTAGTATDNSYHVVEAANVGPTAVLDGFAITGGYANGGGDDDRGGGMLIRNAGPTVSNCTIAANRANSQGEGVYVGGFSPTSPASPSFVGCRFLDNGVQTGNSYGGAIYAEFADLTITGSTFQGNATYLGAGAVHTWRSKLTLTNSTFAGNWARYGGAALSLDQGTNATVTGCTFTGNTTELSGTAAVRGSAMYFTAAMFSGCTFAGNAAGSGGGILVDNGARATADDCTFLRNTATSGGGAVWAWQGKATLTNSRFLGNAAVPQFAGGATEGGAVLTGAYTLADRAFIANCEFVGNRAGTGGAIRENGQYGADVLNCTFVDNAATAEAPGGHAVYATPLTAARPTRIVNSIVWGGPGRAFNNLPTVQYTIVGYAGTGNVNADPLFVRAPAAGGDGAWGTADDDYGDLRLQMQSPAVDSGNNADVPLNYPTDLAGRPRVFDFPGVNDPGAIVDRGAHELNLTLGLLRVPAGQALALPAGGRTFIVERLIVEPGATLDVRDNALVIKPAAGGTGFDDVQAMLRSGFHGGDWLGPGLTSSAAANDASRATALGYARFADLARPDFAGLTGLGPDDVVLMYTLYGDADLNGTVTLADINLAKANFGGTGDVWSTGDFNYDGTTSIADLNAAKAAFGSSRPASWTPTPPPTGSTATLRSTDSPTDDLLQRLATGRLDQP